MIPRGDIFLDTRFGTVHSLATGLQTQHISIITLSISLFTWLSGVVVRAMQLQSHSQVRLPATAFSGSDSVQVVHTRACHYAV